MKNKIRHTIGGFLIVLGILACIGAVGTMDYNIESHIIQSETNLFVQCGIGMVAVIVGSLLCKDVEITLDDIDEQGEKFEKQ